MFNDVRLPETDAWAAMTRDLRQCKESRNALTRENSYVFLCPVVWIEGRDNNELTFPRLRQLKRRLTELESEKEE